MGRTKRRRRRRRPKRGLADRSPNIISLKRWMKRHGWRNGSRLKLDDFEGTTGRGLLSTRRISPGDRLIEVPYELLVTCATVAKKSDLPPAVFRGNFRAQELLALFLVWERRKGENSAWKCYLETLPEDVPRVPWLCEAEELRLLPPDFRTEVEKRRAVFENSYERVGDFASLEEFTWAYVMVNTRAVYVNSDLITRECVTSDEPCMALCPFLDMFNHSHGAATDASLIREDDSWKYVLITSGRFEKREQIFICYGGHDNDALMCEYGFFSPENPHDSFSFSLEDVAAAPGVPPLGEAQLNFCKNRTENLYVSTCGMSFNLKAVSFVALNGGRGDWGDVIFRGSYALPDFKKMHVFAGRLLKNKLELLARAVNEIGAVGSMSAYLRNALDYLTYRVGFAKKLLGVLAEEVNQ